MCRDSKRLVQMAQAGRAPSLPSRWHWERCRLLSHPRGLQDWCGRSCAKLRIVKSLCNVAARSRAVLLEMRLFWAASTVQVSGGGRALHRLAHGIHARGASAAALLPITPSKPVLILLEDPWEYSRDLGENVVSSHENGHSYFDCRAYERATGQSGNVRLADQREGAWRLILPEL